MVKEKNDTCTNQNDRLRSLLIFVRCSFLEGERKKKIPNQLLQLAKREAMACSLQLNLQGDDNPAILQLKILIREEAANKVVSFQFGGLCRKEQFVVTN